MGNEIEQVEAVRLEATERAYSEENFWGKLARFARVAGREVVERALWLYYAMQRPETPAWAKRTIIGALAYFILPIDLMPDLAVLIGFTDDLSVLLVAVTTVSAYITPAVKEQARLKADQWFGPSKPSPSGGS